MSENSNTYNITKDIKECSDKVTDLLNGKNTSFVRTVLESILYNLENNSILNK